LHRRSQRITGGTQGGSTASAMACVREAPHHQQKHEGNGTRLFTGGLPSGGDAYQG
ncbi:unnamed protein product, partial [Ectocarpus sp. 12 AP-2014]